MRSHQSFLKIKDLFLLFKIVSFRSYKKGEIIAKEGEYFKNIMLIQKGIVRTYITTENGTEKTVRLSMENDFVTCAESFINNQPSTESLEAIENCIVFTANINQVEELSFQNSRILRIYTHGLKNAPPKF